MVNILILGRPGSGKGTQAKLLSEQLNVPHISTGDIFRDHMERKTSLGLSILEGMNAGKYVSDEITNAIIKERLAEPDAKNGFILDGYPRTVPQAEFLATENIPVDYVFNINVEEQECVNRLLNRAQQQQRGDDTEEVILNRMKLYTETVEPVATYYDAQHKLTQVEGNQPLEDVFSLLLAFLR